MCLVRQLADAILPSLKLNVFLPTCLALFHVLCFSPLRFPLVLLVLGRSILSLFFILSRCGQIPFFICFSVFLSASFLIEHLGSALQGFHSLYSSFVFFGLLVSVSQYTVHSSLSLSLSPFLCVYLHLPVFPVVKIDAWAHAEFLTKSKSWSFHVIGGVLLWLWGHFWTLYCN